MGRPQAGRENKPHIGIFGRCNAGKSTLLNFITGTMASITSAQEGTTTNPVRKSYEIIGFAPVIFIDTGGIDDRSPLADRRLGATSSAMDQSDLALLVFRQWGEPERELTWQFEQAGLPYIPVCNRIGNAGCPAGDLPAGTFELDILNGTDTERDALLETVKKTLPPEAWQAPAMLGNLVRAGDRVIMVCPIDSEAPAGRMILPQMQAVRETLDRNATAIVIQPAQLPATLQYIPEPTLVITDSQVYREVRDITPAQIEVTTFSILLAAAKGDYGLYTAGLQAVDGLRDGDRILIAENCSHQVSCDDIGRVKIPHWLREYTGRDLLFDFAAGTAPLPADLSGYALMVQCGGCMVTRRQLMQRIRRAAAAGVPVTNYGMLIRKIR